MPALFAFTPRNIQPATVHAALYNLGAAPDDFWMYFSKLKLASAMSRPWHAREQLAAELHPSISEILITDKLREHLRDWREMILEWPHVSDGDALKIAYTRNDADGAADRQTVTTVGRYLKRHAPTMPDHLIRDLVATVTPDTFKMTSDMEEILQAVINGPQSCMDGRNFNNKSDHPYNVYRPALGWSMMIRTDAHGRIMGRCMCHSGHGTDAGPHFVRSYGRDTPDGYSSTDQGIEATLKKLGFEKCSEWATGAQLAKIDGDESGQYLMPYLDGDTQSVSDFGDHFEISHYGDFSTGTSGYITTEDRVCCEHCNEYAPEDEMTWTGYHEDTRVCDSCISDTYVHATGRNGNEYYVHVDRASEVDGDWYVDEYLSDNNIIELANGDLCHLDNAVMLSNDDYVHVDDLDDYVRLEKEADNGAMYADESDAWQDAITGAWYVSDEIEYLEIRVHPDTAHARASYA
jgi:hypothetical protein